MLLRRRTAAVAVLTTVSLALAACGSSDSDTSSSGGSDAAEPLARLEITAPAAPGGGWDSTARKASEVLQSEGLAKNVQVVNVPGAGGTVGLAQFAGAKGQGGKLMTMGLVMVGAVATNKSAATLDDVTPIARISSEQEAVVVPKDSPIQDLDDLVAAWKKDPGAVSIAGGSAGGTDQIFAGLLAEAAGVDPKKVSYVAFSGGGEALAAILGGKVTAGISGASEFADQVAAGELRAIAVSGDEPVEGFDAPTAKEAGLDVVLENWRGFVAPAGISDADREALDTAIAEMRDSAAWKQALTDNGWDDAYLPADEFETFLAEEKTRVEGVLAQLGLV